MEDTLKKAIQQMKSGEERDLMQSILQHITGFISGQSR